MKTLKDSGKPYTDLTHAVFHLYLHIFQLYLKMGCTCIGIEAWIKSKPLRERAKA